MPGRIFIDKQTPLVYKALVTTATELQAQAKAAGLSRTTMELVNIRVSQLNRCVYCLDLHTHLALEAGEAPQRLAVLPGWRETEFFSGLERAALELAEAVTLVAEHHLSDEQYTRARMHLTDEQVSVLLWGAITINAFNRVSILSRHPVPRRPAAAPAAT
ncbi:carboxymuconolactone decarboxylase [Mycobacterium sp. 852002-51163_SCH5372311]|uniref:carboxymuconolactone decarboxylase family protein n=1 Tax=Mycobacterium sp. 852002-51163_SCH5372311 TaxID=1834097 RepID=UPI0007FEB8EE|nr:carboxymuconolactone decarboxylase [Mycobacterium sp. 852002-51163_SCH5372311]